MQSSKRRFKHDCYKCAFLGRVTSEEYTQYSTVPGPYDLYVCDEGPLSRMLIIRYGNIYSAYTVVTIHSAHEHPLFVETKKRAEAFLSSKYKESNT